MQSTYLRNWRQSLNTPYVYRVGNSTLRLQHNYIFCLIVAVFLSTLFFGYPCIRDRICSSTNKVSTTDGYRRHYNATYPITRPIRLSTSISYRIGLIGDFDKDSKDKTTTNTWYSSFKQGFLYWNLIDNSTSILWSRDETRFTSRFSMNGRGMELSELVTFDGRLLTFCDSTGLVYHINGENIYPWVILTMGNGTNIKGMKTEWATVKDQTLYLGSMGKEWTSSSGVFENYNPMWIYTVSPVGEKNSHDWSNNFKKLRRAIGIEFPGYMIHESAVWSDVWQNWFFLPRRCSKEAYNETADETMACNVLLSTDENFTNVKVTKIPGLIPVRGFSSFKFLPESKDSIIVALKSEEFKGETATYITVFTVDGKILLPDERIAARKFEGLEFV